jgi:hypothetical protein
VTTSTTRICPICNQSFTAYQKQSRYCSPTCRRSNDARRKRPKVSGTDLPALTCRQCGKKFRRIGSQVKARYYCGTVCADVATKARAKAKLADNKLDTTLCNKCGKPKAKGDGALCQNCKDYINRYGRTVVDHEVATYRRVSGTCDRCGHRLVESKPFTFCDACGWYEGWEKEAY